MISMGNINVSCYKIYGPSNAFKYTHVFDVKEKQKCNKIHILIDCYNQNFTVIVTIEAGYFLVGKRRHLAPLGLLGLCAKVLYCIVSC